MTTFLLQMAHKASAQNAQNAMIRFFGSSIWQHSTRHSQTVPARSSCLQILLRFQLLTACWTATRVKQIQLFTDSQNQSRN